jgi:hypothetical protein
MRVAVPPSGRPGSDFIPMDPARLLNPVCRSRDHDSGAAAAKGRSRRRAPLSSGGVSVDRVTI